MVPFFVYILKCADGSYYVGSTADLERRVAQHNEGRASRHTAARRPVTLAYCEEHETLESALKRERQTKRWTVKKKTALIEGRLVDLKHLARRTRV